MNLDSVMILVGLGSRTLKNVRRQTKSWLCFMKIKESPFYQSIHYLREYFYALIHYNLRWGIFNSHWLIYWWSNRSSRIWVSFWSLSQKTWPDGYKGYLLFYFCDMSTSFFDWWLWWGWIYICDNTLTSHHSYFMGLSRHFDLTSISFSYRFGMRLGTTGLQF